MKYINKTTILIIVLIATAFIVGRNASDQSTNGSSQSSSIDKEKRFEKDEYCRKEYSSIIKDEVAERWNTYEDQNSVNIKEIFFSPKLNECAYSYEHLQFFDFGMGKELIIARAISGDIIFDEVVESTIEVDKEKNFYPNRKKYEEKLLELKSDEID